MPDFLPGVGAVIGFAYIGWLAVRQAMAFERDRRDEERESVEDMQEQIARGRYTVSRREHV